MRDEIDARIWNEDGQKSAEDMHRLLKTVVVSLKRRHAIQFDAPRRKTKSF